MYVYMYHSVYVHLCNMYIIIGGVAHWIIARAELTADEGTVGRAVADGAQRDMEDIVAVYPSSVDVAKAVRPPRCCSAAND